MTTGAKYRVYAYNASMLIAWALVWKGFLPGVWMFLIIPIWVMLAAWEMKAGPWKK